MSEIVANTLKSQESLNVLDRIAREMVTRRLTGLRNGRILLSDALGAASLGESADLQAHLTVRHPRFFRQAVTGGSLSVAESYKRGDWDCDDLTSLFRIFVRNNSHASRFDAGVAKFFNGIHRIFHWWHTNTRSGSRRNIGAHYDLGNDFFRLWLDETMAYSCAIFPTRDASLAEASTEKFDRVCRRLALKSSDRVLEIGTGWGGFAIHAATRFGCHVTTTTISKEQFDLATHRVKSAGLDDHVTVIREDYRDLRGQFDKLVSIEMIEAVGYRYFDKFFQQCANLLRPDGSLLLQAIIMPEHGYQQYLNSVDFIQRYIFPGGCLPSLGAMLASVSRQTDFQLVHAEDFAPHYAETLRRWRREFNARLEDVRRLGYAEEFIRLWNYYLCYCEAAFEERHVGVLQVQFDRPQCRRPLTARTAYSPAIEKTRVEFACSPTRSPCERSLADR